MKHFDGKDKKHHAENDANGSAFEMLGYDIRANPVGGKRNA
jgi:hypothetical protein